MAENKYSADIRAAYSGLNVLKPALQKLAKEGKTNTKEYRQLLKTFQEAQAKYDKLKQQEKEFLASQKAAKTKKETAPKQADLDIANTQGNTAEANRIAQELKDAGVTPLDLEGNPMKGFEKKPTVDYVGTGTKDKPLTYKGEAYTGTYKGKDYKDGILVVKETAPTPTGAKGGKGATGGDTKDGTQDVKTLWVSYLRSTFAGLEDKVQKAEIDRILTQAINTKMDEETFMSLLEGTVWWQTTLPSMRQFFLDTHDKRNASTFAEKLKNKISGITSKLEDLGIQIQKIDPATGKLIDNSDLLRGVAMEAIKNNWTDDQLDNYLATKSNVVFTGGGTLGSYYDKIAQQAYLYGVTLDDTMKANINMSLLDPTDGRDAQYWLTSVKDMAYDAPENKAFLPALKAGRNLYEVTNSYRQQMAQLLEVDPTSITWNDLMGKVVDGTSGNARTFADFNKQLKQDPLWQYTKNAKETYSNMALDLAKMFGFAG